MAGSTAATVLFLDAPRLMLAILLPPMGAFVQVGFGAPFWWNLAASIIGYMPEIFRLVTLLLTGHAT